MKERFVTLVFNFKVKQVQKRDPNNGYPVGFWVLDSKGLELLLMENGDLYHESTKIDFCPPSIIGLDKKELLS